MDEQATVDTDATAAAEAEARVFGWKPRDEFAGDPADWRPADAFLKRGKEINGFLRKDLNTLKAEIAKRDASLAELQQTMAQFAAFHQETENRAYAKARKDLQAARRQALRENDGDTVAEIEERLDELDEAKPQPRQAPPTRNPEAPDPVLVAWSEANTWYRDNAKLRRIADGYGMQLRQSEPNLVGQAFLDKLTAQVREDFPEHFERGERAGAPAVGGTDTIGRSTGRKTFADLPTDAKEACDKFVKQGLVKSREAYVKDFFTGD